MDDRIQYTSKEREALIKLVGSIELLTRIGDDLARPISMIKYGQRDFKMLHTVSTKLFDELLQVMDKNQLLKLRKNLAGLTVRTGIRNVADPSDAEGRWISYETMSELVSGCKDRCLTCSGMGKEYYDCKLRKAFDDLPTGLHNIESESKGRCPYTMLMI